MSADLLHSSTRLEGLLDIRLRDVIDADIEVFFEHQLDPAAIQMAAFTLPNPIDRQAFNTRWARLRANPGIFIQTILVNRQVAGHVISFGQPGEREISYWLGKSFWGKGVATRAVQRFLQAEITRPLYARAAKDNHASIRVLEKCGFTFLDESRSFASARGMAIDEVVLVLPPEDHPER